MKILCRSRCTSRSTARQSIQSQSMASSSVGGRSSGPFTRGRPTCPSAPAFPVVRFKGSPATCQHAFASGHRARYPASYTRRASGGAAHDVSPSCRLSTYRHSLVGHPVPARDLGFPYGGLTGPLVSGPDPDGVSAYRTCETRLGLGALYIPGIAVSTRPSQVLDRRRPRSNDLIPVSPVLRPDPRSGSHETSARVHGYSPHASLLRACDSRTGR